MRKETAADNPETVLDKQQSTILDKQQSVVGLGNDAGQGDDAEN